MKPKKAVTEKPYNRCLSCHHREGKRCDGPRTSAMPLIRWCEFMRDMKDLNKLTNADIAEKSGVSIKTIERIMALNAEKDLYRETARLIEDAIIGSSNQYPCYLAFEETHPNNEQQLNDAIRELERAVADNEDYRSALNGIHDSYKAEMQLIRDGAQKNVEKLLEELQAAREECKRWHAESEHWRAENDRKGKLIDKYLDKMMSHN